MGVQLFSTYSITQGIYLIDVNLFKRKMSWSITESKWLVYQMYRFIICIDVVWLVLSLASGQLNRPSWVSHLCASPCKTSVMSSYTTNMWALHVWIWLVAYLTNSGYPVESHLALIGPLPNYSPRMQSVPCLTTDECHFFKIRLNENQIWCDAKLCLRDIHMAKHLTVPTAQYREFMIVSELWKKGSAPMCLIWF